MNQIVLMQLVHPLLTLEIHFFFVQRLHGFRQVVTHVQSQQKDDIETGNSDCENFTGGEHQKEVLKLKFGLKMLKIRHAGSWLGQLPLTKNENCCRYADWRPICVTDQMGVFVGSGPKWTATHTDKKPTQDKEEDRQPTQATKQDRGEKERKGN